MALTDTTTAEYRYFLTNLVTNQPIAEIPFKGVSYERVLKGAGTFSGSIPNAPENESIGLYESTMPGRTGLYVVRDGVCVWGGMIWSRSYNINDRILQVSASEFTSYFHHRRIWKTFGQVFEANLDVTNGLVKVTLRSGSGYELNPGSTVRIEFTESQNQIYNGTYTVLAGGDVVNSLVAPAPTKEVFYVSTPGTSGDSLLPTIPNGSYSSVTVYARTNTYDYVRSLINAMSDDFSNIEFANNEIQPAKLVTENVILKRVVNGVAILQTEENSNVVPGQEVTIKNVDPLIDGKRTVSSVRENIITIDNVEGIVPTTSLENKKYDIIRREATRTGAQSSLVTVTTSEPHDIVVGSTVDVANLDLPDSGSRVLDVTNKVIAQESSDPKVFSYTVNRPLEMVPITIPKPTATVGSNSSTILKTQVETIGNQRVATITTLEPNNFSTGETVTISNLKYYATVTKFKTNIDETTTESLGGTSGVPLSIDYYTKSKPPLNYLSPGDSESSLNASINVSGFVTTTNIISRYMVRDVANSIATFTVTTDAPHGVPVGKSFPWNAVGSSSSSNVIGTGLVIFTVDLNNPFIPLDSVLAVGSRIGFENITGAINGSVYGTIVDINGFDITMYANSATPAGFTVSSWTVLTDAFPNVTISGLVDSYRIRSYSFSTADNIATFFTGAENSPLDHNIQATSSAGRFTVSGISSAQTFQVTAIRQQGSSEGSVMSLTTSVPANLLANTKVEVFGIDSDIQAASFTVKEVSRVSNVTTITTTIPHNLKIGDTFTYGGTDNVGQGATGTFTVKGVSGEDKFFYDNPVAPTVGNVTSTLTLQCIESFSWDNRGRLTEENLSDKNNVGILFQGIIGASFGVKVGAARFQSFASQLPENVVLSDVVSIDSLSARLVRNDVGGTNRPAYLGVHGSPNLTTVSPPVGVTGATAVKTGNLKRSTANSVNLPNDWGQYFLNGIARGIILGLVTPPSTYYSQTGDAIGIFGQGAGDNAPTISVKYTYRTGRNSNFKQVGTNLGTVSSAYSGYDGTYTLYENSIGNVIKVFNRRGKSTDGTVSVSGGLSPLSALNKTYSGNEIISKTANSITVQAPPIGVNVSSEVLIVGGNQKITEDSIFNTSDSLIPGRALSATNETQFSYIKVNNYNSNVNSEATSPTGKARNSASRFNVKNAPIISDVVLENGLYKTRIFYDAPRVRVGLTDTKTTVVLESDSHLNGDYQIESTAEGNTFKFNILNDYETYESLPTYGFAEASNQGTISYGTYGSFTGSSDLGFDFSTLASSDNNILPNSYRGFELTNIGEELEKYTDRVEGFDYRVDCYINPEENAFKREFVMIPVFPPDVKNYIDSQPNGELPAGEAVPIKYFGADKLVFEFPGNISDLQLEENAENAVTRFFMVGNISDLGDDVSQPYAASSDTELLNPTNGSYPWPLLDDDEATNSISDEEELYSYAERYMSENKPPAGAFSVTVNGSIEPIVGSYAPGDWCSLIINDDFIKQRLSSDLEPRNNILLRKINSYSVEVPDSVTFPETIRLELIPEWQVDKRGK